MQVDYVSFLGRDSISSLWNKSLKSQSGLSPPRFRNVKNISNFYFNLFITRLYERYTFHPYKGKKNSLAINAIRLGEIRKITVPTL